MEQGFRKKYIGGTGFRKKIYWWNRGSVKKYWWNRGSVTNYILVEQGLRSHEVSMQFGLYVKVVCAPIQKHQETRYVEDKSRSGRLKKTTIRLDYVLVQTSFAECPLR